MGNFIVADFLTRSTFKSYFIVIEIGAQQQFENVHHFIVFNKFGGFQCDTVSCSAAILTRCLIVVQRSHTQSSLKDVE